MGNGIRGPGAGSCTLSGIRFASTAGTDLIGMNGTTGYIRDVVHSMVLRDVLTGLVKSLAFATIIVHVGCLEGFHVRGGPDAVGRSTTAAVVKSTFLVILADVGFTALFYLTGGK